MRKRLIGACAATALLGLASIAAAHPGGGPGGVPGGLPGHSAGVPGSIGNPNGAPPIGRATNAPDTDRGHSEGKGHTDLHQKPTVGRVTSFNGSLLTLTLPNGSTKTFAVDSRAFGQLRPAKGMRVAVTSNDGAHASLVVPADQTIRGTVSAISKDLVTLKLPNGRQETISVAPQAAANMNLTPGASVIMTSHDGGVTALRVSVDRH